MTSKRLFSLMLLLSILIISSCEKEIVLAEVLTSTATSVTSTSASGTINIVNTGGADITEKGICWGLTANPTLSTSFVIKYGSGSAATPWSITGLTPGRVYYVRPYAISKAGLNYGNEVSFTTEAVASSVNTTTVTQITSVGAVSGGTILSDGGTTITIRGVCWSTVANPTTANSKTTDGTGTGSYSSTLSSLTAGTTYYLRAYATNSKGTSYGPQISFTTLSILSTLTTSDLTAISSNSATSGGTITDDGSAAIVSKGVCWSTGPNPTIGGFKTVDTDLAILNASFSSSNAPAGSYVSHLTALNPNTLYYVRAYVTNSVGTSYGNEKSFTTLVGEATVSTTAISSISSTGAQGGGSITNDGGSPVTVRGICWSTSANPTISDSKTTEAGGTGTFTSTLIGLDPGTTYYVRAYATNSRGTSYGNQAIFVTFSVVPTLSDITVSELSAAGAVIGSHITNDGGTPVTARGVCWSTHANPIVLENKTNDGTGTGSFSSTLSGLSPNVTYYVRAYATNKYGTYYSNHATFTTLKTLPAVTTTATTTSITLSSAASGGTVTSDGGDASTQRGVCWSTSANPTISSSKTIEGTGTGLFTSSLTGLSAGATYYVRAYATNSVGTSYGSQISFTTLPDLPTLTTNSSTTNITSSSATSGGTISYDGGLSITARGVCWSTSANPTTANSKTSDGTSVGSFTSSITGLSQVTTYYVRAYATNSIGTSYGSQISFTTLPNLPILTTNSSTTNITLSSATSGGTISDDGGASITARGVCWSTSANPTTANSKTSDGTSVGSFTSSLTGLSAGATYYVRAYATNSVGTSYGSQISFTTLPDFPTLTTNSSTTNITLSSATSGGTISNDGGASITARGVCWSTSANPTTANSKTSDGTSVGSFTSSLTGLSAGTTYYVRAYATNSVGTSYGSQVSFTTQVVDVDGNVYNVVAIGTQKWIGENLKTTKYNDGTAIPNVTDNATWGSLATGAYCDYNNTPSNSDTYARLYNWFAVDNNAATKVASNGGKNICPVGWHVPSITEWATLSTFLGGNEFAGGKLKEAGTTHWTTPNTGATNETGFTALPGGNRSTSGFAFQNIGLQVYWWSANQLNATNGYMRNTNYTSAWFDDLNFGKKAGFSVRCLRD